MTGSATSSAPSSAANTGPGNGVPPPAAPSGEVSLVKGRSVSLQKGQRVSLRKDDGVALSMIRMGLGWDAMKKRGLFGRSYGTWLGGVESLNVTCIAVNDGFE